MNRPEYRHAIIARRRDNIMKGEKIIIEVIVLGNWTKNGWRQGVGGGGRERQRDR